MTDNTRPETNWDNEEVKAKAHREIDWDDEEVKAKAHRVRELVQQGKSDEYIAEDLRISVEEVVTIRQILAI